MLAKSTLKYGSNNLTRVFTDYLSKVAEHVATEFPSQQAQCQQYCPIVAMVHTEIVGDRTITDNVRKHPPHEWQTLRSPFDKRSWTPREAMIMGDEVTVNAEGEGAQSVQS
jgi:hypothetical protein